MRALRTIILYLLLLPCLAFSSGGKEQSSFRISAIMPEDSVFWARIYDGMERGAEENGLSLSLYTYSTGERSDSQLEKVLLSKPDGILLCDSNYKERRGELLMEALSKGIPVVLFDTDTAEKGLRSAFVGIDNIEAGRQAARETAIRTDGPAVLVGANLEQTSSASKQRLIGIQEGLEAQGREYVTEIFLGDEMERNTAMQGLLRLYPEGTAYACFNSPNTILMAQSVELLGLGDGTFLIGFSEEDQAFSYVEDGVIDVLITQDNFELGRKSAEALARILSGGETPREILIEPAIVTKDNLAYYWKDGARMR